MQGPQALEPVVKTEQNVSGVTVQGPTRLCILANVVGRAITCIRHGTDMSF